MLVKQLGSKQMLDYELDWTGLDWTELHAHTTCPSPQLHPVSCLGSNSPMLCPSPSWFRSRFFFKSALRVTPLQLHV